MSYAVIFPGQGAQEVGMGRDLYESCPRAREIFEEADAALGFSLSDVIFNGPEEELVKTAMAQPAILTVSLAALAAFESELGRKLQPVCFAGHSLGEYTALAAAGALPLADGVKLVHTRGSLMQSAVPLGKGAMSAVLGLDLDAIRAICEEAAEGEVCTPANVNAPTQIVVSGDAGAVERAGALAKERGASKVIPLKVSAPFHCELMRPVAEQLREEFAALSWGDPSAPVIANVDAGAVRTAQDARRALYEQTYSPVLWAQDVLAMDELGASLYFEFGPGNVLAGLIKRVVKGRKTCSVGKSQDIAGAIAALGDA